MTTNTAKTPANGFVALASVLVIAAIVLLIGISAAALSLNEIQSSLSTKKGDQARYLVESCIDDALLYLNENNSLPATVTINGETCSVTIDAQVGTTWTFTATATSDSSTKSIRITAERTSQVVITAWSEQ